MQHEMIYYIKDEYLAGYRVWREGWASDQFEIVPHERFETFMDVGVSIGLTFRDMTD